MGSALYHPAAHTAAHHITPTALATGLSLLFAAVAAIASVVAAQKAVETVRLTIREAHRADMRRLTDSLDSIITAATHMPKDSLGHAVAATAAFGAAQSELRRALMAVRRVPGLHEEMNRLIATTAWQRPNAVVMTAATVLDKLLEEDD
ncbi:MAG TPA: hypothetical protein VMF14_23280 [Solirubrobacteraceae bacterium]|nr:hypothetical protein [Solirubrobacteraceae bacterium]